MNKTALTTRYYIAKNHYL